MKEMSEKDFRDILKIYKGINQINTIGWNLKTYKDYLQKTLDGNYLVNVDAISKDIDETLWEMARIAEKLSKFINERGLNE